MFDMLEADIVIMQEIKIQRKDLRDDMVLVPGWDVHFSLPRHKKGGAERTRPALPANHAVQDIPASPSIPDTQSAAPSVRRRASPGFSPPRTHPPGSETSPQTSKSVAIPDRDRQPAPLTKPLWTPRAAALSSNSRPSSSLASTAPPRGTIPEASSACLFSTRWTRGYATSLPWGSKSSSLAI